MKKVATHRKNRTIRAAAVLLILVLLSTMGVGMSVARNTTGSMASDAARGAAFVFRVQDVNGVFQIPVDINEPGEEINYPFKVTNKDFTVCETDQEYTITLKMEGSLPLVCTLTKTSQIAGNTVNDIAEDVAVLNALETPTAEENAQGYLDENIAQHSSIFQANTESIDSYNLHIKWPEAEKDPKYAGGVAEVEVNIVSVQID